MSKQKTSMIATLSFWLFVVVKVAGSSLAAWSWWWLLLPIVPAIVFVLNALKVSF